MAEIAIALKFKEHPSPPVHEATARKQVVVDRLRGKSSKDQVNYRRCNDTSTQACCAECEHYLLPGNPTSSCRRVAGIVEAEDTCDLFTARPDEGQGQQGTASGEGLK